MKFLVNFGERKKVIECEPDELYYVIQSVFDLRNEDLYFEYFDKTFQEYVEIDDFENLETESRIRVKINESPKNTRIIQSNRTQQQTIKKFDNITDMGQKLNDPKTLMNSFIKLALKYNENDKDEDDIVNRKHLGVKCDKCEREEFTLDRYKCLICKDYDLCGKCFEKKLCNNFHKTSHPMVCFSAPGEIFDDQINNKEINLENFKLKFKNFTHSLFECNGCSNESIKGVRFKCYDCNDYDLCYNCYESEIETKNHKKNHRLILIGKSLCFNSKDIKFEKELGRGGFGSVHKVKLMPNDKIFACKVITYQPLMEVLGKSLKSLVNSYCRECEAYNELKSNYIVKMYGHCYEKENKEVKFYMLMEYMERGSLAKVIRLENDSLTLHCRLKMACNIASGLAKIHEKNFIHRDIRPDNILVTADYTAKIGDMGIAKLAENNEENEAHTMVGCLPYMPNEFYSRKYDNKLDIFTFGLTLYELFTRKKHENNNRVINLPEESPFFSKLIKNCLDENPKKRLDAASIERNLNVYNNIISSEMNKQKEFFSKQQKDEIFIEYYNYTSEKLEELEFE